MAYPGDERDPDAPIELGDDDLANAEQLTLADPDERLPWLESVDDDDAEGADTSRMVAFAVIGLIAVVALVGLLWWLTRDRPDAAVVADGSVIEAPAAYKERPKTPGGTEVSGTGNTSFAVGEGRSVETRIGGAPAAAPVEPAGEPAAAASPGAASTKPAAAGGIGVQVGAYSTKATAEAGWQQLSSRLAPLQGRSHRVLEGTADSGTIYRLQAVAATVAEAEELCRNLRAAGGDCQVKR